MVGLALGDALIDPEHVRERERERERERDHSMINHLINSLPLDMLISFTILEWLTKMKLIILIRKQI